MSLELYLFFGYSFLLLLGQWQNAASVFQAGQLPFITRGMVMQNSQPESQECQLGTSSFPQKKSIILEYVEAIVIAVILALFIRTFIVQAFKIPSGSMLETLQIGDHVLVSKFIYGIKVPFTGKVLIPIKEPKCGDIVVFKYPQDPSLDYIKRVIAVGGETVESRDKKIFINGKPLAPDHGQFKDEQIIPASDGPRDNFGPLVVPMGKIFVMGDNRDNSYDSRFWGFVDLDAVRGKAFILYWSWDVNKSLLSVDRFTSIRWGRIGNLVW